MKRLTCSLALLVLLVGPGYPVDLDSLLVASVGGEAALERLRSVENIYSAGRISLNGQPGQFRMYLRGPDQIRFELVMGSFGMTQAYDGHYAWQQDHNNMVSELSGFEKRKLISQAYFQTFSFLFTDRMPGSKAYLGTEERAGETMHKVAFVPTLHDTVWSYFDTGDARTRFDVTFLDNIESVTEYRDHRLFEGVKMAFHSTATLISVQTAIDFSVDTIDFDAAIDPRVFEPPTTVADYRFPAGVDSVRLKFDFIAGHIFIEAAVNGRRLAFMLDSGASANLFHRPALEGLEIPVVGSLPAHGIGGSERIKLVKTDSLVLGRLVINAQVGGATDLGSIGRAWQGEVPFGGILGYDFLARFPVLVDYEKSALTIYRPESFFPPAGGHEIPFQLTLQVPTIEGTLAGIAGQYLVDLGNSLGLIVHRDFVRQHQLEERLDDLTDLGQAIDGVGGDVGGKSAYAAAFAFGDIRVTDLRILLPDSSGGLTGSVELAGNIGNRLLNQFRVLFDYSGRRLIFYETVGKDE